MSKFNSAAILEKDVSRTFPNSYATKDVRWRFYSAHERGAARRAVAQFVFDDASVSLVQVTSAYVRIKAPGTMSRGVSRRRVRMPSDSLTKDVDTRSAASDMTVVAYICALQKILVSRVVTAAHLLGNSCCVDRNVHQKRHLKNGSKTHSTPQILRSRLRIETFFNSWRV